MSLPVINPALSLPQPEAIEALSAQVLQQAWVTKFLELEPDYDVANLESDPGPVIAEAMSFLRLLDRARINDAYSALRLALARGANLDGLGADRGVRRLVFVPADPITGTGAVMEKDEPFRLRIWLKMQTWGRGSPFGIEYNARTIGLDAIADARCYDYPGTGRFLLVVLPTPDFVAPFDPVLGTIAAYVMDRVRRPGAGVIDTIQAEILPVDVTGVLSIRRGASAQAVVDSATAALSAYMSERRRVGAVVPAAQLYSKVCQADVVNARLSPSADIQPKPTAAGELRSVNLSVELVDD